jgi:hypothetical protein
MSMDACMKSNPRLDRTVNESTNFEDMREALKTELTMQGIITRNREDGNYGAQLVPGYHAEPAAEVSVPEAPRAQNCVRVVYPKGNDRYEIFGASEQELDLKEAQIRSLYRV